MQYLENLEKSVLQQMLLLLRQAQLLLLHLLPFAALVGGLEEGAWFVVAAAIAEVSNASFFRFSLPLQNLSRRSKALQGRDRRRFRGQGKGARFVSWLRGNGTEGKRG